MASKNVGSLTVLPEFVLFLAALDEALGALLQGLDEDGLGHLEGRGVGLPQLQVDVGEDVAHDGGVTDGSEKKKKSGDVRGIFLKRKFSKNGRSR